MGNFRNYNYDTNGRSIFGLIIILCIWFAALTNLYLISANKIALYIVIPFALCLSIGNYGFITKNKYQNILTALIIWICFSYLWAEHKIAAGNELKQLVGTFAIAYTYTAVSQNIRRIPYLYATYIILFIGACIYAKNNILLEMGSETDRLTDDTLNANTLAYFLFYATFAIYELRNFANKWIFKKLFGIGFILMIPMTLVVALLTASRQVLIVQIPLISILLYLRYIKGARFFTKAICIILIGISAIIATPYVSELYNDSYLKTRNEMDISDDGRMVLLKDAIDVGNRHFPIGVGPGNYIFYSQNRLFSHNTYTELYANEGVIGLWLYVWMVLLFIKRQWHRYKTSYDNQYLVFLAFGIIYIFDGFFYVFYPHLWLMGMFMLVAGHSETYYSMCTLKHKRHES